MRVATVTKSRLVGFPEYDRFTLQDGAQDLGYVEFARRYGRDFIEAESKPLVFATPENVAEVKRLVALLKIEPDELDKILTKANAETVEEMSDEHAVKFIAALKKKISGGADEAEPESIVAKTVKNKKPAAEEPAEQEAVNA